MTEERIQKILARAGFGSRRASEVLIADGRVRVNGVLVELGARADAERDQITVDGQPIPTSAPAGIYIALNKPRFVLSDNVLDDPRKTVFDLVPVSGQLFIVGRLDFESEGLVLLTNDGELANRLTHPRYGHEKEYRVLVAKRPDEEQLEVWRRGVVLEDGHRTSPADVRIESTSGKGAWLRIIMHEGRKRQIREICTQIGLPVVRILRVRIGSLQLGGLKPGEWRDLMPLEVRALKAAAPEQEKNRPVKPRPVAGSVKKYSPKPRAVSGTDKKYSPRSRPSAGTNKKYTPKPKPAAGTNKEKVKLRPGTGSDKKYPAKPQPTNRNRK
ncbi:MAG: pseudouridine synthase [Bellilinea sp.]